MDKVKFPSHKFSFGLELEFGDVTRIDLGDLGSWDNCERDIVNTMPPYRGLAADPLGVRPPVGGEINTRPTIGIPAQMDVVRGILAKFKEHNQTPTSGPSAHGHVHVHVPGLIDDIEALKKLTWFVMRAQQEMVRVCGKYKENAEMSNEAKRYLKHDGGRLLPEYIARNIQDKATNFEQFIKMHAAGKDGVSMGRPFRHAINMYCLKHTKTVEFRMFRGTTDENQILHSLLACHQFMDIALNTPEEQWHVNMGDMFKAWSCADFAPMKWDLELWQGLHRTKHDEKRGKKARKYVELH